MVYVHNEQSMDKLQGVIAVYSNSLAFLPYEDNTLQPERMPLKKDLNKLLTLLKSNENHTNYTFNGIIPKNVLHFKQDACHIVWTTEPKQVQLLFKASLPMDSGVYTVPRLLWQLNDASLKIFALKADTIENGTPLYQAPFLNVSDNGTVCMGNVKTNLHKPVYNEIMAFIENQFFSSYFTHTNCDSLVKGSITSMYLEQQSKKSKKFNNALLIKSILTISDIL